jgi:membrane protease YdiL (CAAX protease family)
MMPLPSARVGAGFFEELGCSGVAVPRLLQRHGILATGMGVGVVWGAWQYLAIHWGSANAVGSVHPLLFLTVAPFSFLPPYRVLMVWVYQHARSLLLGILMHMALIS